MTKSRKILLLFAFFAAVECVAQSRSGNLYEFLDMPTSSRATALGGNQAVLGCDEPGFVFSNPAVLRDTLDGSIGLNVSPMPAGIVCGSAIYARHVEQVKGNVSVGIQYVNYGSFDWTDENGDELGSFNAQDVAVSLTYARSFSPNFTMAATLKPIFSRLHDYGSFGLAMDMGATYVSDNDRFRAGVVVRNVGAQIKRYDSEEHDEHLNTDMRIGLSFRPEHAPFRVALTLKDIFHWDLSVNRYHPISFGDNLMRHLLLGVEFVPVKSFFVGFGYNQRVRKENRDASTGGAAGFSWGCGFRVARIDISYARAKYHLAGSSNSITISTNLNRFLHGR